MKYIIKSLFIISLLSIFSCDDDVSDTYYKDEMRGFIKGISEHARLKNANFIVIPQNGIELITSDGEEDSELDTSYLSAIDGHGQEDLFYGYDDDNESSPAKETSYLKTFLNMSLHNGKTILVTDYCWTTTKMESSFSKNNSNSYIGFAAPDRGLNQIPSYPSPLNNENSENILKLAQAKNFLYLINPEKYSTKQDLINAIIATNYDLAIIDLFLDENIEFTATEVEQLRQKANGGRRLVVCYMSIGEAEDYRYYWKNSWEKGNPDWLDKENKDWEGNFKVKYWNQEWQSIIYGSDNAYLDKIVNAGFDGVYLDIVDAFEYYE